MGGALSRGIRLVPGTLVALQGIGFLATSGAALSASASIADILCAENFDQAGFTPGWFGPWRFAMTHFEIVWIIFMLVGMSVLVLGLRFIIEGLSLLVLGLRSPRRFQNAWEPIQIVCWLAALCALLLAVALVPLTNAGSDWPVGTRAQALNRMAAAKLYLLLIQASLLATTARLLGQPRIRAWCS
jgi:hypothetical protein